MRYVKPFTLIQRHKAIAVYRSMRITLDKMRFDFPPATAAERRLLRQYRKAARDSRVSSATQMLKWTSFA
jgi:hypothetical protein